MTAQDFILDSYSNTLQEGVFTWSSPSNIALVKYWGKKENQIPTNPSISFTLDTCRTTTTLKYQRIKTSDSFSFDVFLDGNKKDDFKPKIATFFNRIFEYLPFLKDFHFSIKTSNSFPHSSGIASSASGMSALALCLMSIEKELAKELNDNYFFKKASFLARLGSGSACRSIEGDLVVWGGHQQIEGSKDLFGVKYPKEVHKNFENYRDTILLVETGEKQVSSTVGHNLMNGHPFAEQRFSQAKTNLTELITVFKSGDLNRFISIVESEALSLHAMMMMSNPSFILMKPSTLEIINRVWQFRKESSLHLCFTLDAGANVHLLYPASEAKDIEPFISEELLAFCKDRKHIKDTVGVGARQL